MNRDVLFFKNNPFGIKGYSDLDPDLVRKRKRDLLKKYHPDLNKNKKEATENTREIIEQEEVFQKIHSKFEADKNLFGINDKVNYSNILIKKDELLDKIRLGEEHAATESQVNESFERLKKCADELKINVQSSTDKDEIEKLTEGAHNETFNFKRSTENAKERSKGTEAVRSPKRHHNYWSELADRSPRTERAKRVKRVKREAVVSFTKDILKGIGLFIHGLLMMLLLIISIVTTGGFLFTPLPETLYSATISAGALFLLLVIYDLVNRTCYRDRFTYFRLATTISIIWLFIIASRYILETLWVMTEVTWVGVAVPLFLIGIIAAVPLSFLQMMWQNEEFFKKYFS